MKGKFPMISDRYKSGFIEGGFQSKYRVNQRRLSRLLRAAKNASTGWYNAVRAEIGESRRSPKGRPYVFSSRSRRALFTIYKELLTRAFSRGISWLPQMPNFKTMKLPQ